MTNPQRNHMDQHDAYDEDADIAAGFSDASTDATDPANAASGSDTLDAGAADAQPPGANKADAEPQPAEQGKADPFASLPQEVRDLLADVPRMRDELSTLRRTAGMVPALQSKLDRLERDRVATPPAPTPEAPPRLPKVAGLREQGLDDIADAMEELAAAMPRSQPAPDAAKPAATEPSQGDAATPVQGDPATGVLDDLRPTWADDLNSTEFQLWLVRQPAAVQTEIRSTNRPGVLIRHLQAWDTSRTATTPAAPPATSARMQRIAAAVTPRGDGRTGRAAPASDDEDAAMNAGFYGR